MLLWDNGFENSLKTSTAMGSKNLFSTGSFVLNKDKILWKNEIQKESTHSDLYFMACFILIPHLGVKAQTWRHYFQNTTHI